jgi:phage terminase large subunit-like protein
VELAIYRACTGRIDPPETSHREAWLVCGRRGGKSYALALIAVFLACFIDYRRYLAPGERAMILVIATDRKQARSIFRYIRGLLTASPVLAQAIESETAEAIDLNNSVTIEVGTASHRSTRGYTIAAALCDEIAFWPTDEAAEPDFAVLDALRPGMATIPNAKLLCASSPYARRGALWDACRRHFGKEGAPTLVWKAPTSTMNPTVPQGLIDDAYERDAASAAAE